jgi:hypothetical protein
MSGLCRRGSRSIRACSRRCGASSPNRARAQGHRTVKTKTDQAIVIDGCFGVDARNLLDVRLMNMAAKILTTRATETIREKEQLAYGHP